MLLASWPTLQWISAARARKSHCENASHRKGDLLRCTSHCKNGFLFFVYLKLWNGAIHIVGCKTLRAQRLKKFNVDWNFQSRLKISISLEIFNPGPSEFPTKITKKRFLQKSEGNFLEQSPGGFCGGFFGGWIFFGPLFLEKEFGSFAAKIHTARIRPWKIRVLAGGSLEAFNLASQFQSWRAILNFSITSYRSLASRDVGELCNSTLFHGHPPEVSPVLWDAWHPPDLREASDAIAVRRVNSDAAFRTTFSRVWRFTLFAFASVIFTWLKYACVSPILTQGRCWLAP